MTAVLGTLPFLATLWLLVVLGAAILEESGAKIAAALKGETASVPVATPRTRARYRLPQVRRVSASLRAAA
jgi:hypothetical protein